MNLWCALLYCLSGILLRLSGFMSIIVLPAHILLYPLYPPASCSLSYHVLRTIGLYVLGSLWHEIKVYRWGFPCLDYSFDVLVSWSCDLKPYNHVCSSLALFSFTAIHVLTLVRHLAFAPLAWGVSLTPLDPHVQVIELRACGFFLLLIRVAQR